MPNPGLSADEMREALQAYHDNGYSKQRAADALGLPVTTYTSRLRRAQRADGLSVTGTSTLYDMDGKEVMQWVKTSASSAATDEAREAVYRGIAERIKPLKPRKPKGQFSQDLCACYPVGDHHFGMLSWKPETGHDWDMDIGERVIRGAMDALIEVTPACDTAFIAVLGDYQHWDGFVPETPKSKNSLDADGRFPKLVEVATRTLRYLIECALNKHKNLHLIVEAGNHDPVSSVFLRVMLAALYEREPRVTVDDSPGSFHYFRFGKVLVGTHHGDTVKIGSRNTKAGERLPLIMAHDRPDDWGQTKHRYWWTGHVHHDRVIDHIGCRVESFRVLPPADAWHTESGYRAAREMKAIILHKEYGEVARHSVNPDMLI
jgi:hypothetical protein